MTEKNQQEQNAAQRQTELLTNALENAKTNGGLLLNASGKLAPRFYQHETSVSPFNALTLALHSDANNYQTNLYTLFNEAKKRGESVQTGQKGVPFVWYSWNEYQSKSDPDVRISREDYQKLGQEEQNGYKPVREREVRSLFNIEQTTMPMVNKEAFPFRRNPTNPPHSVFPFAEARQTHLILFSPLSHSDKSKFSRAPTCRLPTNPLHSVPTFVGFRQIKNH